MKKPKQINSQLREDMIFEIMLKLPLKSVVRFKSVSKQWCNLITDSVFARAHLSKHQDISSFIFQFQDESNSRISIINVKEAQRSNLRGELFQAVNIPLPTVSKLNFQNNCDGILCAFFVTSGRILLWNPITKWTKEIDYPGKNDASNLGMVGFGYDSSIKDYKVVRISSSHIEIINLQSNEWRSATNVLQENLLSNSKVYLNGILYWTIPYRRLGDMIISFNFEKEKLSIVQKPREDMKFTECCVLTTFRAKLCLIFKGVFGYGDCHEKGGGYEIWLMKEENNWIKLFEVNLPCYSAICGIHEALIFRTDIKVLPHFICGDSENGESYKSFETSEIYDGFRSRGTGYVASLISPHT